MNPHRLPARALLLRAATLLLSVLLLIVLLPPPSADARSMPAASNWLQTVNAYRAMAGVPAVSASSSLSYGADLHSKYVVTNGEITHFEDPSKPGYTPEGDQAGQNSVVTGTVDTTAHTSRHIIDKWMVAPFHAMRVIDPRLTVTGYGRASGPFGSKTLTVGTLDVMSTASSWSGAPDPFTWPGHGSTVPLNSYNGGEQPNPLAPCSGYSAPTGLPLIAAFGTPALLSSASLTVVSGPDAGTRVTSCAYDESDHPSAIASGAMWERGAVIVIPRAPLRFCTNYRLVVRATDGRVRTSTFHVARDAYEPAGTGVPASPSCPDAGGGNSDGGTLGGGTGSTPTSGGVTFTDVDASNVFHADIYALAASGITKGCNPPTNTRFCPDDPVTRGQMAAFLVRALGLPAGSRTFSDTRGHVFERDVAALATAGITSGCGTNRFCPDDPVTRGEMAAFIDRALGLASGSASFSDTRGHLFEESIASLAAAGITKGCNPPTNTRFCPDDPVTRQQMAAFLVRAGLAS